jgi:hypothetical protein
MKRSIVLMMLMGALLILALGASASSAVRLRANVPFAFYVDSTLLPPGEYWFEMRALTPAAASSSAVFVRNQEGTVAAWVHSRSGDGIFRQNADQVHFNRYGSKYFLSRVESSGYQANLTASPAEREYRVAVKAQDTVLRAGK